MPEFTPEQFGARGNMGENGATAMDATSGIQAAVNAAVRPRSEFVLTDNVLTPAMKAHVIAHAPLMRTVRFDSGAYYRVTDSIKVKSLWNGIIDGNGAYILWDGPPDKPMFLLQDCRNLRFQNFRLIAHQDRPCLAGIQQENYTPASGTPNVTPTANWFENVHMYGNAGGFVYGFRAAKGTGGDNNNEMHDFSHCSVYDYVEAAWSIEHSQSKHHRFYGCQFQAGRTGKRGVSLRCPQVAPNGNGSFAWFGGGGGGNSVCDFQLAGPLENVLIQYAEIEQSRRLLSTSFDEVISGLLGVMPAPPSLTMTTPGGSAYILGAPVNNPGFTFTYPPNSDTYDLLKQDSTVQHKSIANGAAPFNFDGNTSWLQRVVTDGTKIVRVDRIGGSFVGPSGVASPTTIIGCRWSSDQEPADGDVIAYMQCGNLNLVGNRFYTKRQHARFRLLALDAQRQAKLIAHGNTFRCERPLPWPNPRERMLMDRGDGSIMQTVPWSGSWLGNANDPVPTANVPTIDQTWRNGVEATTAN